MEKAWNYRSKSVSEERRRDRLQVWKNEQRAVQLFKVLGEKQNWDEEKNLLLDDRSY